MTPYRVPFLIALTVIACGCIEPETRESEAERVFGDIMARQMPKTPPERRSGNVSVMVDRILVDRSNSVHLSAAWRYTDEKIAASGGGGRLARENGIRIGVAKDGFAVQLQAALTKLRIKDTTRTFLTTLSGRQAVINVGQTTYIEILRYRTLAGERVLLERAFVGASLMIEPTILPDDRIRVKLYPRLTTREGKSINLTEVATEVILDHAQPLVLGGMGRSNESTGFALFSWSKAGRRRDVTMIVTPYIEAAP